MDTFKNALKETLRIGGREILREKNRLSAYLADLAPDQKREVRIFSKSCSEAMLRMFDEADGRDRETRLRTVYKVRHMLMEEEGLTEVWAENMVRSLVYALDWECMIDVKEDCSQTVCGTVVATGDNSYGQCGIGEWKEITAVACGNGHTAGLKKDGTVAAVGDYRAGQCSVSEWKEITAVACGNCHTIGLKKDGTVMAAGANSHGQCSVGEWKEITAVACGAWHTAGLKKDGTVVVAGDRIMQCSVSGWKDITAVTCGAWYTAGLKKDGTVVTTEPFARCSKWKEIIAVAGRGFMIGLKKDGTIVATGYNKGGEHIVSEWKEITAVACGAWHTAGLKKDGTVVAAGDHSSGQCNVNGWRGITAIACGNEYTVGLKKMVQ